MTIVDISSLVQLSGRDLVMSFLVMRSRFFPRRRCRRGFPEGEVLTKMIGCGIHIRAT